MLTKRQLLWAVCAVLPLAGLLHGFLPAQEVGPNPLPSGMEILTRGPVHEAFAQPIAQNPGPGQAVPKEPPPPISEKAPEEQPPGNNVQWIPGYWAWDAERNDFIWISGTFRKAPPGRQFVAGHWVNTSDGWQWVAGFRAPDGQKDIVYAAQPPEPLNSNPSMPPPDDNSLYVPGYWFYQDSTFVWRPGYYMPNQQDLMWVMPNYVWTPGGYVYVPGYWDYPLDNRGLLFAPVAFNNPLWQTPGWFYRPNYWVSLNPFYSSLFGRPGSNHYYFGNYYGANYARLGYRPWYAGGYNPLYNYYTWANRSTNNWLAGQQRFFNDRHTGIVAGPPRTFAQQTLNNRIVLPLNQFPNSQNSTARLIPSNGANQFNSALSQSRISNESFRTASMTAGPRLVAGGSLSNAINARPGAVPSNFNTLARPNGSSYLPVHPNAGGNLYAAAKIQAPQVHSVNPGAMHMTHAAPAVSHAAHSAPAHSAPAHVGGGHGGRR